MRRVQGDASHRGRRHRRVIAPDQARRLSADADRHGRGRRRPGAEEYPPGSEVEGRIRERYTYPQSPPLSGVAHASRTLTMFCTRLPPEISVGPRRAQRYRYREHSRSPIEPRLIMGTSPMPSSRLRRSGRGALIGRGARRCRTVARSCQTSRDLSGCAPAARTRSTRPARSRRQARRARRNFEEVACADEGFAVRIDHANDQLARDTIAGVAHRA